MLAITWLGDGLLCDPAHVWFDDSFNPQRVVRAEGHANGSAPPKIGACLRVSRGQPPAVMCLSHTASVPRVRRFPWTLYLDHGA